MILTYCDPCHRVISFHLELDNLAWAFVFMAHSMSFFSDHRDCLTQRARKLAAKGTQ